MLKPFSFLDLDYSQLEPGLESYLHACKGDTTGISSGRLSCQEPATCYMDKHGNLVSETPQERDTINRRARQYRAGGQDTF